MYISIKTNKKNNSQSLSKKVIGNPKNLPFSKNFLGIVLFFSQLLIDLTILMNYLPCETSKQTPNTDKKFIVLALFFILNLFIAK